MRTSLFLKCGVVRSRDFVAMPDMGTPLLKGDSSISSCKAVGRMSLSG
jgi:hypothetical protein